MEEKKEKLEIKNEKSKDTKEGEVVEKIENVKPKKEKWLKLKHFRVFGFALIFLGLVVCILLTVIFFTKYFEFAQNNNGSNTGNTEQSPIVTVTDDENVIINVVKQSTPSVVSIAISQVT